MKVAVYIISALVLLLMISVLITEQYRVPEDSTHTAPTVPAEPAQQPVTPQQPAQPRTKKTDGPEIFSSEKELIDFLRKQQRHQERHAEHISTFALNSAAVPATAGLARTAVTATEAPQAFQQAREKSSDHSTTNIQIEGVDEADIVKNDGHYIYFLSGGNLHIVEAYPPRRARLLSTITFKDYEEFDSISTPRNLYINDNSAAVIAAVREDGEPYTIILMYDITDKENPALTHTARFSGNYVNSRMIDGRIYTVTNEYVDFFNNRIRIPRFSQRQRAFPEIRHFPSLHDSSYVFTNVASVDIKSGETNSTVFLLGGSSGIFVSRDNLYIHYQHTPENPEIPIYRHMLGLLIKEVPSAIIQERAKEALAILEDGAYEELEAHLETIAGLVEEWIERDVEGSAQLFRRLEEQMEDIEARIERNARQTVIHKVGIRDGDISYRTRGSVIGRPLNQFSFDEHQGYLRIATTTGWGRDSLNHVFVLNDKLKQVGSVEDLAPGERIFSARFIGDRLYLVTFVQVDPLFVIDLSKPWSPRVLGELKIPGVSDYLHPYDEDHLIGVGRSTHDTVGRGGFKGIKVSLFDVSDVHDPRERATYEVGDSGSSTSVTYDHKAFLFDKKRKLLVLPATLRESRNTVWSGALVLRVTEKSIRERGRISHTDTREKYLNHAVAIQRSLYIDDVLYTISPSMIMANDLQNLKKLRWIKLPFEEEYYGRPVPLEGAVLR